jgi:hypothetical protein
MSASPATIAFLTYKQAFSLSSISTRYTGSAWRRYWWKTVMGEGFITVLVSMTIESFISTTWTAPVSMLKLREIVSLANRDKRRSLTYQLSWLMLLKLRPAEGGLLRCTKREHNISARKQHLSNVIFRPSRTRRLTMRCHLCGSTRSTCSQSCPYLERGALFSNSLIGAAT